MRADEVPIPSPCSEDRDRMRLDPDGLRRHCDRCNKPVHDLSAMGPERARALLQARRGSICVSYLRDEDGEIHFDSARPAASAKSDFVPLVRLAQAASLVASLSACSPADAESPLPLHESVPILEMSTSVVIPHQPPAPEPSVPAIEEPCEPKPAPARRGKREKVELVLIQGDPL